MNKRVLYISIMLALVLTACNNAPSPSQLVAQGNHAYYENQYAAAFQAYAEAMDTVPFAGEPVYNAANTFYRQEQYTDTLESLSESLALSLGNFEDEPNDELIQFTHYNMGNTRFSQEEWEAAIEAYKEALRLRPDDVSAKYNLELALQRLKEEAPEQEQQQDQQNEDQEQQDQPDEQTQSEEQSTPEDQPQDNAPPEEQQEDESGQDQDSGQEQAENQAEEDQQSGQSSEEGNDESDASQQQEAEQQQPQEGLSVEQARQLVGTVGENAETLQERLQQIYVAPNPPSEKDW